MSTATKSELNELKDLIIAQSGQLRIQSEQLPLFKISRYSIRYSQS
jgi:hypothetical protein